MFVAFIHSSRVEFLHPSQLQLSQPQYRHHRLPIHRGSGLRQLTTCEDARKN